ncbi:MAG: hypothetical protein WBB36_04580, partial [Chitinophagales bacterium]
MKKQPEEDNSPIEKWEKKIDLLEKKLHETTLELEKKNRELEIEAALDKVTVVAMSMKQPDDLLNICEVLFMELQALGFIELRNSMINIHNDADKTFVNYDYSDAIGKSINHLAYNIHPVIENQVSQIRSADDAFSETIFSGNDLKEWKKFRKRIGEKDDPRINKSTALYYYFYSIGKGAIGISAFSPVIDEKLEVLKRFRNVFSLSYQRYIDIALAEAQAKEARIETALERVRSVAMAMRKPEELAGISETLFTALKALGFADLRNTEIIINNNAKESIVSYYYSDYGITGIIEVFYNNNPIVKAWVTELRKANNAFAEVIIPENEMATWRAYREEIGYLPDPKLNEATSVYYYSYSIGLGALSISSFKPVAADQIKILEQFRNVFNLSYQRYADIALAEAQAKEARIEAALERVRSKAMSMMQPADMLEVCTVISNQLELLGVKEIRNIQTAIFNEEKSTYFNYEFYTKHNKTIITETDYKNHPVQREFADQMLKGAGEVFIYAFKGNEVKDWIAYQKTTNVFIDSFLEQATALCYYWNSLGSVALGMSTYILLNKEEIELFKRFKNVFELAYQRYSDIALAEAQAREAQIEASLERVRGRAMAMHNSEDLSATVNVFFKELKTLGIIPIRCGVGQVDEASHTTSLTTTTYSQQGDTFQIIGKLKQEGHPVLEGIYDHWKLQQEYFPVLSGDDIKAYYEVTQGQIAYPEYSTNVTQYGNQFPFKEGFVFAWTENELTEEERKVFRRFSSVLSLTYRRFSDLKEAEAQTREAQIQLALERVRARTMAMQHSDELQDAAIVLFQQIKSLGVETGSCGFNIWDKDEEAATVWMSSPEGGLQAPFKLVHTESEIYKDVYEVARSRKDFLVKEVSGDTLKKHFDYLLTVPGIGSVIKKLRETGYSFPESMIYHFAFFNQGYLSFHLHESRPETHDIFKRFANVFQQTYTRFLDLQKAEAQAREAKIEVALERVRASTMAMQKSTELADASRVLFGQMISLVPNLWSCGFVLCDKNKTVDEWWLSGGNGYMPDLVLPNVGDATHANIYKAWLQGASYHEEVVEGEALQQHYHWLMTIPVAKAAFEAQAASGIPKPVWQQLSCAYFTQGYLVVITETPCHEADILKRFAKVFEQTYTRFLDLQKAEAQAREAQIEAALERVRSKAMSMYKSEDLHAAVAIVFEELEKLDLGVLRCGISVLNKQRRCGKIWLISTDGDKAVKVTGDESFDIHPLLHGAFEAWLKQEDFYYVLEGEDLVNYYKAVQNAA